MDSITPSLKSMKLIYRGGWKVYGLLSDKLETHAQEGEIIQSILSRDYKGLRNHDANVVIEIYEVSQ